MFLPIVMYPSRRFFGAVELQSKTTSLYYQHCGNPTNHVMSWSWLCLPYSVWVSGSVQKFTGPQPKYTVTGQEKQWRQSTDQPKWLIVINNIPVIYYWCLTELKSRDVEGNYNMEFLDLSSGFFTISGLKRNVFSSICFTFVFIYLRRDSAH